MADGPGAEVGGSALAGLHGCGRAHALGRRGRGGRGGGSKRPAAVNVLLESVECGRVRVDDRLVTWDSGAELL